MLLLSAQLAGRYIAPLFPAKNTNVIAAQRTIMPSEVYSVKVESRLFRSMQHAHPQGDISNLKLVYINWYRDGATFGVATAVGNSVTISACIEYPAGVYTNVTFNGGSSSAVVASGGQIVSDAVSITIPAGARFWVRTKYVVPNGAVDSIPATLLPGDSSVTLTGEGGKSGTSASITLTDSLTPYSGVYSSGPVAITGDINHANPRSILLFGNSIAVGEGETLTVDANGGAGYLARRLRKIGSYAKLSRGGSRVRVCLADTTKLDALLAVLDYTDVVSEHAVTDLNAYDDPTGTYADNLSLLARCRSDARKWLCTCTPLLAKPTIINTYNALVRAASGIYGYVEASDAFSSARDSDVWRVFYQAYTADNVHPTSFGYEFATSELPPVFLLGNEGLPFSPTDITHLGVWYRADHPDLPSSGAISGFPADASYLFQLKQSNATNRPTIASQAVTFDGSNDYMVADYHVMSTPAPMTVFMRVKITNPQPGASSGRLITEQGGSAGWLLGAITGNGLRFFWNGSTPVQRITSTGVFNNSDYHSLIATYDGTTTATGIKIYVNGVECSYTTTTNGVTLANVSQNTLMGADTAGGNPCGFTVKDAGVYKKVLSAAEIALLNTFLMRA